MEPGEIDAEFVTDKKYHYKNLTDDEKEKLLEQKDKKNTQRATTQAINNLSVFLRRKSLPSVDDIDVDLLSQALYDYYPAIRPQRNTQSKHSNA